MEFKNYDKLKMFPVCKNNGDAESRSLVFKISRSVMNPINENFASSSTEISKLDEKHVLQDNISISMSEENKNTETPDFELVSGKTSEDTSISIQKDIQLEILPEVKTSPNVEVSPTGEIVQEVEIPHSSAEQEKVSQVRRRSLRLLTLESRLKSSQNSSCIKVEMSNESSEEKNDPALGINVSHKLSASVAKKIPQRNKRKNNSRKSTPAPKNRRKSLNNSQTSNTTQIINTRKLKLKSMLIVPTPLNPSPLSATAVRQNLGISTPKFANVDPSHVMSTLFQQGNAIIEPGKPVSVFFTSEHPTQVPRPGQVNTSREKLTYVHHLNKGKKDLAYLCKKYHMLDHVTLDNCYGKVFELKKQSK